MGVSAEVAGAADYGYSFVSGDYDAAKGEHRPSATGADRALIRVEVTNPREATGRYASRDAATGANPALRNPLTGKTWGAEDPAGLDDGLRFGGALPWEAGQISFTAMAASHSWRISPSLADIRAVMAEVGAARTVLAIYFRQPYVLDEASGLRDAGAILAGFGVSDTAILDVVSGRSRPQGKLPFALARRLEAVTENAADAPGYPSADTLFPFGFGLTYASATDGASR
jgi:beta-glucosidase